jgi:FixJ family two-component response regulator
MAKEVAPILPGTGPRKQEEDVSRSSKIRADQKQPVEAGQTPDASRREPRVLLVDADARSAAAIEACANNGSPLRAFTARTLADARRQLQQRGPIDLLVVSREQSDGEALAFVREVAAGPKLVQSIVIAEAMDTAFAIDAMRAGACDLLPKPLDLEDTNRRLREALTRQDKSKASVRRVRRLRKLCKKLSRDRQEVSQQVDILCNDLVTAYQELADQMQQVVQGSEYGALVKHELDLEQALRTTLEFLVQKAGPTNAAIFLPATMDEYSLGGYVNFDCPGDTADMLLDHLADVVAPKLTDRDELEHIQTDQQMEAWIGDDAAYLAESELVAFSARHDDETLAVIALFRDQSQPFDRVVLDACASVGPILGEALARIIRVHHRHMPDLLPDDEIGEDGGSHDEGFDGLSFDDDDSIPF